MKRIAVKRLVLLALLFITISYLQVSSIALAGNPPTTPSVPSGSTSGLSETYSGYITKASDPDGNQLKYTFDWGDGTVSTTCLVNQGVAVKVFHKWAVSTGSAKIFNIKAKATDSSGSASAWSNPLSVAVSSSTTQDQVAENNPPATPSIPSGSTSGSSGTSYSYSTKGTDPDGDSVMYIFDWGDGTKSSTSLVSSGSSASASHAWTVASGSTKTFSVSATAMDKSGKESSPSGALSVTIKGPNNPPEVPSVPSGSTSGVSGSSYSYSTKANDPDGNRVKYTFDWGDGTTTTTSLVASGTSASVSHSWTVAAGSTKTFSVSAKATDESGKESSPSGALSVTIKGPVASSSNSPPGIPYIPSGDLVGLSGESLAYYTKATDPDGDQVRITFDWGDGTTFITPPVSSGATASASHIWTTAPGTSKTFSIRVKATDEHETVSSWSNPKSIIIVAEKLQRPPTIPSKPSGPTLGTSGNTYGYSTSSTDPDGDKIKYIFDWGDGSTSTGYFPSGQVVTATHSWIVPAGLTRTFNVRAFSADSRNMICPYPYWSDVLTVTIKGSSSIPAYTSGLIYQGDEAISVQNEEANCTDEQINESEFLDEQSQEADPIDEMSEELDSLDEPSQEIDPLDEVDEESCPLAVDDFYFIPSNESILKISAPGLLENDQYGSDRPLSIRISSQPAHAADFAMNPDGSFTYTSIQDYCGEDSFTYTISDGDCESNEATVNIFIECYSNYEEEVTY